MTVLIQKGRSLSHGTKPERVPNNNQTKKIYAHGKRVNMISLKNRKEQPLFPV